METKEDNARGMKRLFTWGIFILIIGLITWGMIAAGKKADRENAATATVDRVAATDHVKGATTSPVTIIEYSDFQCPACAAYFPLVERVIAESAGSVLFVYRHFPLTRHLNAEPAAMAAEAAGRQGKFWEMYGKLFENQELWAESTEAHIIFENYAKELKLNMVTYNDDVTSLELRKKINDDQKSGIKAGVNSTPTFYVNGQKITNPQTYEQFKKLIEDAALAPKNS